MSKKLGHRRHNIGQRRRWWLVAAGAVFVVALALVLSAGQPGSPKAAAELAPDLTLTTLQGDFRLSEKRGDILALYFSFVG